LKLDTGNSVVKLYIKPKCKSCQKAVKYLEKKDVSFEVLDIMKSPPAKKLLEKAVDALDPKGAFNRRAKGYKEHSIESATFKTKKEVVDLLRANPDMIRRPLLARGEKAILGFDEADYATFLR
jgi:Spx/MgsR family transcriptional regulator